MSLDYKALLNELGLEDSFDEQNTTFNQAQHPKPRLIININVSDEEQKQLILYEGQEISDAVYDFCSQNKLDQEAYGQIIRMIQDQFNTPSKEEQEYYNTQDNNTSFTATPQPHSPAEYENEEDFNDDHDDFGFQKPRNVYERLYQKAVDKKIQLEEIDQTNSKSNQIKLQQYWQQNKQPPGIRLYQTGQKRQKVKEYQLEKMRQQQQEEQEQEMTFTPNTNQNKSKNVDENELIRRLTRQPGKSQNQNHKQNREDNCTFRPKISEISNQLAHFMKQSRQFDNVYDQLYFQGKMKNIKSNEVTKQLNAIPFVQQTYSRNSQKVKSSVGFLERVQNDIIKKKNKIDFLREQSQNIDMKTGERLHTPKIGRGPSNRHRRDITIYDQLYDQASQIQMKLEQLQEDEKRDLENLMVKCSEKSNDIIVEQRKSCLKSMFYQMDQGDNDGVVRCSAAEQNYLPKLQQEKMSKIFTQINLDYPRGIQIDDFVEVVYKSTLTLPQVDKDLIFLSSKKAKILIDPECTFKPKINKKSKQMVQTKYEYPPCKCDVCMECYQILGMLNETH